MAMNSPFVPQHMQDPQTIVTAKIKPAEGGRSEILIFTIPLKPFWSILCIANIPAEGENEAPVYVKKPISQEDRARGLDEQKVYTARIKPAGHDGQSEVLVFTIPIGDFFELICIANIPGEGEEEAPVYVKWKLNPEGNTLATDDRKNNLRPRPRRPARQSYQNDDSSSGDVSEFNRTEY